MHFLSLLLYEMWDLVAGHGLPGLACARLSLTLLLSPTITNIIENNDGMSLESTLYISEIRYINAIKYYFKKSHKLKEQHRVDGALRLFVRKQLPFH